MTISEYFKDYDFLFDSHAHLSTGSFTNDEAAEVLKKAKENGVEKVFDMGVDLKSSRLAVERAATAMGKGDSSTAAVAAFVGIDPEVFEPGAEMFIGLDIAESWFDEQQDALRQIIISSENLDENSSKPEKIPGKIIAGIGETGMDFYHFKKESAEIREKSTELQKKLFIKHLELSEEFKLPVSIHSRAAEKECLEIVKSFPNTFGIFHSYTGDYETAVKILDAGWGLGVNGIVTFKNAEALREMYGRILEKYSGSQSEINPQYFYSKGIFFETDSPYLSPEGKRGEKNEPANAKQMYAALVNLVQNLP